MVLLYSMTFVSCCYAIRLLRWRNFRVGIAIHRNSRQRPCATCRNLGFVRHNFFRRGEKTMEAIFHAFCWFGRRLVCKRTLSSDFRALISNIHACMCIPGNTFLASGGSYTGCGLRRSYGGSAGDRRNTHCRLLPGAPEP